MESPFVEGQKEESECADQGSACVKGEHSLRRWGVGTFMGLLIAILLAPMVFCLYRFRSPELRTYYQARKNESEGTEKIQYYPALCHFSSKQSASMSLSDYVGRLPKIKCHGVSQEEAERFVGSVLQSIPEKIADSISSYYTVEVHNRALSVKADNTITYGTNEQLSRNINAYYDIEDLSGSIVVLAHEIGHSFLEQTAEYFVENGYYTAESLPLISFHFADNDYCHSKYQEFMSQYFCEFIYYNDNCKAASEDFFNIFSKAIDEYHFKWWHLI